MNLKLNDDSVSAHARLYSFGGLVGVLTGLGGMNQLKVSSDPETGNIFIELVGESADAEEPNRITIALPKTDAVAIAQFIYSLSYSHRHE